MQNEMQIKIYNKPSNQTLLVQKLYMKRRTYIKHKKIILLWELKQKCEGERLLSASQMRYVAEVDVWYF